MNDYPVAPFPRVPSLQATTVAEPKLSKSLHHLVYMAQHYSDTQMIPEDLRKEAEWALREYETIIRPHDKQRIILWLSSVNAGMGNPVPFQEFAARAIEVASALSDLPGTVFNHATRTEAQRLFRFFPGASELYKLLQPHAAPLTAKAIALRQLLNAPPATPEPEPTAEELAAMRARVRALVYPNGKPEPAPPQTPTARTSGPAPMALSEAALVSLWRHEARSSDEKRAMGARLRLKALGVETTAPRAPPPTDNQPWW